MASSHKLAWLLSLLVLSITATCEPCKSFNFPNNVNYATCKDLGVLDSSLFWNYHQSSNRVDVAFKKANTTDSSWVAWAINPTSQGMVGSQAFLAFRNSSDATLKAYTSSVTSYDTLLEEGSLSFPVYSVSASYSNGDMILFASFKLPENTTLLNHVWQEGPVSDDGTLGMHSLSGPNIQSFGTIDFVTGKVSETAGNSKIKLRKVHGILNGISWGILMPIGAILARYLKVFDGRLGATWFHVHRACQSMAYIIGIIGFATGSYMTRHNRHHSSHGCIGITLICLASLQVCVAMFLRPKKDHRHRIFWNIFHYVIGYLTIGLGIWNVFKGIDIMEARGWKSVYLGVIICLALIAIVLEVITWILLCINKLNTHSKDQADVVDQQNP
ncbi:hypothetical protein HN51_000283 [Arachis hypogaea]|uniref:Cytochrome b561 and DOMON domain-containing protein n=1 Tax=Arachis hypogaea TaxID=3818 RepID=A0A445EWJ2_ARAHY|nr:cytochrome b561 and DOMON domain-containing protein At5g47530-like [Arachis hypogaea]QHO48115.1 Cytochrome b561 and DOMON domain-containing protein [Arachis hypogaea]RYR79784.1 hypothetical protein Ahy_A01g004592 [Arachis hypogaea]